MTSSTKRGLLDAIWDKYFGWSKGLPPERCNFSVQHIRIPLEDKIQVWAKLYLPVDYEPLGTLLVRNPYGLDWPSSVKVARVYAARGYQVLYSSCRGTSDDSGEFTPAVNEFRDGHATVAWMRRQTWYTGSFATLGGSYLGYNQLALLREPPKDMVAASIMTGVCNFGKFIRGSGALGDNIIIWADIVTVIKDGTFAIMRAVTSQKKRLQPVIDTVPLLDSVNRHFKGKPPKWLPPLLETSGLDDEPLRSMQHEAALDVSNIPTLLTTGWNDLVLSDVMNQYYTLKKHNVSVALDIGPWTHLGCQDAPNTYQETLNLFDIHLAKKTSKTRPSPVHVFVNGANEWRDLPSWPPPTTSYELFLDAGKNLSKTLPSSAASSSSFDFDPADPTPSVAHPLIFDNGLGRADTDGPLATRADTLVFETSVLSEDVEVCGQPLIQLQHSTDSPYADLLVLLSEVDANGRSKSITDLYIRLDPQRDQTRPIDLALVDCANRFRKGCKIRLIIAGGSHPRYIRNLGTGEDPLRGTAMRVVKHTVRFDAGASKLTLPVTTGA